MSSFRPTVLVGVIGIVVTLTLGACGSSGGGSASSPPVSTSSSPVPSSSGAVPPTGSATSTAAVAGPSLPAGGPVPARFVPYSVTFASTTTAYVLGTAPCAHAPCTSVLRSLDDGAHWVGIHAPVAPLSTDGSVTDGHVGRLRFADPLHGYASGGALYTTADGGNTWQQQHIGSTRLVLDVQTSAGYAWALAEKCASTSSCDVAQLWRARVGSTSWAYAGDVAVGLPAGGSYLPRLTVVSSSAFVWFNNTLAHATTTSNLVTAGTPCYGSTTAAGIAAADALHLDAMCVGDGGAGSSQQQLRGSTDGGRGWSNSGPSRIGPAYVTGIADNAHGVLVESASSGGSELLRTTNDGASFAPARVSAPSGGIPWADLGFTTPTQGIVVLVGHGLYLSHDAGATWAAVSF